MKEAMVEATPAVAGSQDSRYLLDSERFLGSLFLFPAVLYIIALVGVPFFLAIAFSMTDATVGDTSLDFVGLRNFLSVTRTPEFRRALLDSFLFTIIAQITVVILANVLAVILSQEFRGKWLARMLIMLPWATPIALGTIGWLWLLDSKFSPFDWLLQQMGLLGPDTLLGPGLHMTFLGRERLAVVSVIVVHIWRTLPLAAVILLAGLTSIPQDLLDQAEVDGASFWRIHFQVVLPLIMPIMSIALLFGLIFTFSDLVVTFVLTRGGPVYYTQVLPLWAWFKGINGGALGEGAAIALFIFPVLLAVAILILRAARRSEVA
ncbi:MAG: sugar ABC transporter permease [Chloroflexi bacterium]|nr:sugar ABC transporter permease [Chloroflexota bacterium]MCI0579442.1 sugar ABC transporter permease [Chloroflexota bacterium]MCI0644989.1 sugar ABC transporter permease [Chloroflexota bacterium]MCI0732179.1 sugar ABC transporter permease [Chloroflexota bacterium]